MTEEIPYRVIGQLGELEVRSYPAILVASVSDHTENEAFRYLFHYISGNNRAGTKIAMTAPVLAAEKIPMTAPVITDAATMSFVMPGGYATGDLPEPLDREVRLGELPPRDVAVIRFAGKTGADMVREKTARLLAILEEHRVVVTGSPFLMRYNSPFVPGFLRRNEVGVPVVWIAPSPEKTEMDSITG